MPVDTTKSRSRNGLRAAVFVLTGLATAIMLVILVIASGQLTSGEKLSRDLSWALIYIYGVTYLVCIVPALLLALLNWWLPLALALCLLSVPMLFVVFRLA